MSPQRQSTVVAGVICAKEERPRLSWRTNNSVYITGLWQLIMWADLHSDRVCLCAIESPTRQRVPLSRPA
jgi:hypothetical protein